MNRLRRRASATVLRDDDVERERNLIAIAAIAALVDLREGKPVDTKAALASVAVQLKDSPVQAAMWLAERARISFSEAQNMVAAGSQKGLRK